MDRIFEADSRLEGGRIAAGTSREEIIDRVMDRKQIVVLKQAFSDEMVTSLRAHVQAWGEAVPPVSADDFRANYHRQRVMISRIQQAPHVFHDYNFNDLDAMPQPLQAGLREFFEPLRTLYNDLTGYDTEFGIPASGPYVHPQVIHYPSGGGFFGRHWHSLVPQKLGFIVSLSKRGRDFHNGGTCFDIDGDIVDMEKNQDVGDICVWRYDYHHWVTQSDLQHKFDWSSDSGRWVATFAYFDPYA